MVNFRFLRYFRFRYNHKSIKIELLIKFRFQKISYFGKLLEKKINLAYFRSRPEVRRLIFHDSESELNFASFEHSFVMFQRYLPYKSVIFQSISGFHGTSGLDTTKKV